MNCRFCKSEINDEAKKCPYCHEWIIRQFWQHSKFWYNFAFLFLVLLPFIFIGFLILLGFVLYNLGHYFPPPVFKF
ncbi:MAG: hypothetical protein UX51_C0047G0008 [Candidatus Azambacteria bacterium GW2011_GWF2_46_32]|uniref:Zinc ribbon domain-containing protein n=2 Tax=Candidatus Azamiibacteriota TaxID=1752741 RepID=A0A0G1SDC8_9BACT|nr:MAG: hypothetical protein UX51_C0047G0008 [Candidatus Azambacteria bacterium GW2011_GWF2_46_32]KKU40088.1 MAG: hypothetical protein UX55_C0015G0020 [Candidatus Azambacteria bacterium GW2011_GWE2_46_45]